MLLTWATAWRPPSDAANCPAFAIGGPFRCVRNPHYISYFLLRIALGTFQSRTGFPIMLAGEIILLLRLTGREEMRLAREYGQRFREYAKYVPRFWPWWRPRIAADGSRPQ
jgi:protein-S-isoprenylcysteine O-methyltransferase Ste14